MMKIRKIFLALLLILTVASSSAWAKNPDKDIIILYTNDVHCGVDMNIGYAGLVYYKHEVEKKTPYVTLVDAGDAVQGEVIGAISNGRYIIDIMNAVSYDIAVPGNHEFDYGMPQFENFTENLKCGYISCNFRDLRTGELVFKPYKIINYGNIKVAFIGICTPSSTKASISLMDENRNFIFDFDGELTGKKLCASVQNAVDAARADGADFVIAVGHLGENTDIYEWSAPFIAAHTRGIDAFIDGHSHEVTPCMLVKNLDNKDVIITQTGTKLKYIGQMTIDTSGKIKTELIKDVTGRDDKIADFIHEIKNRYEDTLNTRLGRTSFDLVINNNDGKRIVRKRETNLGDLICDSFLDAALEHGGADLAINNAGDMRADIKSGEVTYNDALSVMPFGKSLHICELSGQTILDELELSALRSPEEFGGFLHVSNMSYTIDSRIKSPVQLDDRSMLKNIADGERRVKDVMIGGKPLEPDKKYRVISTRYVLIERGDGHMFNEAKIVTPGFSSEADALAHYIKKLGTIPEIYKNPDGQGRIKIIK